MPENPLPELIKDYGSEAKLAAALGVSQPLICKMKNAEHVSPKIAVRLERLTNGRVPLWKMRPDIWSEPKSETVAA